MDGFLVGTRHPLRLRCGPEYMTEFLDMQKFLSKLIFSRSFKTLLGCEMKGIPRDGAVRDLTFKVDRLPAEGISGRRLLPSSWFTLPPKADDPLHPIRIVDPIAVDFHLTCSGRDVLARVAASTRASLTCSRCLEVFLFPVRAQTRFTFCRKSHPGDSQRALELDIEDLETATFEGDEIDLSELVYEQIVLSFPIKPLCHEGCLGLCPRCGVNRNLEACGCHAERLDPRWEVLGKLKLRP
jgi:uncharacterized protein